MLVCILPSFLRTHQNFEFIYLETRVIRRDRDKEKDLSSAGYATDSDTSHACASVK